MVVNFIECSTLNWVLIREEKYAGGGFGGTTYHSPHVILKKLEALDKSSTDPDGTEIKRYSPGIYRTKNNEKW